MTETIADLQNNPPTARTQTTAMFGKSSTKTTAKPSPFPSRVERLLAILVEVERQSLQPKQP